MILAKYTSEAIIIEPKVMVPDDMLHYLVAVPQPDGTILLAPTQGKLMAVGGQGQQVWAYLRFHREPFYLVLHEGPGARLGILSPDQLLLGKRTLVEAVARLEEVFDRRHLRVDPEFETPGVASSAAAEYDKIVASAASSLSATTAQ